MCFARLNFLFFFAVWDGIVEFLSVRLRDAMTVPEHCSNTLLP
jgi:hypothetical protein